MELADTNLEYKYVVIKDDDQKYLTEQQKTQLQTILSYIRQGRHNDGKKLNDYVVTNLDEPWAHKVVDIVEEEYGLRR